MEPEIKRTATAVFCNVCEESAFMFAEPVAPSHLPSGEPDSLRTDITYTGPFSGSMMLAAPFTMCHELAANMRSGDKEKAGASQKATEALQKLLTITCRQFLAALSGEETVFDLSPPTSARIDLPAWNHLNALPGTLQILVEDYPVLLHINIEQ
jgi:CheY-specific phosphatase CheX